MTDIWPPLTAEKSSSTDANAMPLDVERRENLASTVTQDVVQLSWRVNASNEMVQIDMVGQV